MKDKTTTTEQAMALIRDGDVVTTTGFVQSCIPEMLHAALEKRFLDQGAPRDLTLIMCAGAGDSKGLGTGRLHHDGLLRRVIAGNFGRMPKVAQAAQENKICGYNLPQGVISQLYRACAAGQPGLFSKVGLHTYVDPRHGGGKVNKVTEEDIVKYVQVDGEDWLFYKATKIDVAFIRGTSADRSGNISMEREALTLDCLAQAMAAHNNGGIVIAQVERIVEDGSIKPKDVKIPGLLVDCVCVADDPEMHRMNYGVQHNPALSGEIRVPLGGIPKMPLDQRKIIARRAAFELPPNGAVNLGVGAPDGVAAVANEEKATPYITLTTEAGAVGGVLAGGSSFGSSANADAIIDQNQMFDFYDGGGLDLTCLGMAECDAEGSVNASRFGGRLNGCGGFINISQNSRAVVFAGTFTAGGLKVAVENGELRIVQEGRNKKFVRLIEQITFSGPYASQRSQPVLYVTERCVLQLTPKGLELIEIAPGIDLQRDILDQMEFRPIIENVTLMDPRIFREEPMGLMKDLLNLNLSERVTYDAARHTMFLNLEGWSVRKKQDVEDLARVLQDAFARSGRDVNMVMNQNGFRIAEDLQDDYAASVGETLDRNSASIAHYTTSAFMRLKMQGELASRSVQPHIFESGEEAHQAIWGS
ncbi:malonate decarboxylase subunit alpha [Leisingera aquaemixtae]|uniref:acyl CoA:acetate/3-ketoacid CoA transferase n=1 Tax=Leisingera aquaemixtae TaxID=1396826 RepID=UPI0021A48B91|nr:malonate decarboxylase subunit alpha [Leisingera aquaemixtae]UWQ23985.1 malonate decarboxylase subunit alpha [Leisingera aquaemixtae]UWQ44865.1 malonate decarboxylase subunit alpha [Leisingera aquaemixtae]